MDKIYSRPRIRMPNNLKGKFSRGSREDKKIKIMLTAIVIIAISLCTVRGIGNYIAPTVDLLSGNIAESTATRVFNEQTLEVMKEYQYEDLCTTTKDSNGNVTMLKANINPINEIKSKIAINVQNTLDNSQNQMTIKLRNFYRK